MKKKTELLKLIIASFAFVLCVCCMGRMDASAASSVKYSYTKKDKTKTYGTHKAIVYYKRVVVKGNSAAVKKINKSIKSDMNSFLTSSSVTGEYGIYDYAEGAGEYGVTDDYFYYAVSKVTYNKKGILSIKITTHWWAGGVNNTDVYGLTYNLKTGEKLNLTQVCSGNASSVKKQVLAKIRKDKESSTMDWTTLNSYSAKKMDFYLNKNGKAVVCFGPYEINYGGWYRTFTIKSKYS